MMATSAASEDGMESTVVLSELTQHLTCPLCGGYYIDATTIVECLHTFCRSCILRHLQNTRCCPAAGCDVLVQRTHGAVSLRPDTTMQSIVYKTVPGLHRDEMRKRQLFYADKPNADADLSPDSRGFAEGDGAYFYDANDTIDVRIQYASKCPEDVVPMRYLRCPADLPLAVLRKFLHRKYRLPEHLRMELLHGAWQLPTDVKLMDVAYIVNWNREVPLELLFRLRKTRPTSKRPSDVPQPASDRPSKVRKLDRITTSASTAHQSENEKHPNHEVETAAKESTEVASSPRNGSSIEEGEKRKHINDSFCAGGSTKPSGEKVRGKLNSFGLASRRKITNETANATTLATRGEVTETKSRTVVANERIDKKRKSNTMVRNEKDKTKDTASFPTPSKDRKSVSFDPEQKFSSKSRTCSATSTQRADSMPVLPIDNVGSCGKGDRELEAVHQGPIKHIGDKSKAPTTVLNKRIDKSQDRLAARISFERQGQKGCKPDSKDNSRIGLKDKDDAHLQLDQAEKNSKRQDSEVKRGHEKETDAATPSWKQNADQKKTNSKGVSLESFQTPCSKDRKRAKLPMNSFSAAGKRSQSARIHCSIPTSSLQVAGAKQNQGQPTKTTSHGTNTILSSSPGVNKPQASSSSAATAKAFCTTATGLHSKCGETSKVGLSHRCSPSSPKSATGPDGRGPSSKTIFLFSGSKKPQTNNKIMSIVESLTKKSLLSSLAQKGGSAGSTNQRVKKGSGASSAQEGSSAGSSNKQMKENSDAVNSTPLANALVAPKTTTASTNGTFVAPAPVPATSAAATPCRSISSPLHIETGSLGLRYSSAVPPLSSLSHAVPASASFSSRPVFPVLPLPQRPKSQSVRSIPNPSLVRQRSAEERARDCGKGSPTAGSTAPALSPPSIKDIHSLTRQLKEAGTSVTITNTTC